MLALHSNGSGYVVGEEVAITVNDITASVAPPSCIWKWNESTRSYQQLCGNVSAIHNNY